jgi:DNA-binding MarR family transcriptional regulator
VQKTVEIDRVVIENYIEANLNESDWAIMKALYDNPAISNKVLADQISLSVEGAKSSLKKMYSLFEIPLSRNMKLALILKVINLTTI